MLERPAFLGQVPIVGMGQPDQAPLPLPPEVIYRHPNPDGTRKACRNCVMWVATQNLCTIHGPDISIRENEYCNYHLYGAPAAKMGMDMDFVTPDLSGLKMAGGGLSCDVCVHFRESDKPGAGNCVAVRNPDTGKPPAHVEALGICSRQKAI